jgi:hypothetical protein
MAPAVSGALVFCEQNWRLATGNEEVFAAGPPVASALAED